MAVKRLKSRYSAFCVHPQLLVIELLKQHPHFRPLLPRVGRRRGLCCRPLWLCHRRACHPALFFPDLPLDVAPLPHHPADFGAGLLPLLMGGHPLGRDAALRHVSGNAPVRLRQAVGNALRN